MSCGNFSLCLLSLMLLTEHWPLRASCDRNMQCDRKKWRFQCIYCFNHGVSIQLNLTTEQLNINTLYYYCIQKREQSTIFAFTAGLNDGVNKEEIGELKTEVCFGYLSLRVRFSVFWSKPPYLKKAKNSIGENIFKYRNLLFISNLTERLNLPDFPFLNFLLDPYFHSPFQHFVLHDESYLFSSKLILIISWSFSSLPSS